jgi:flavorubredoxin
MIATSHGLIWRKNIGTIVEAYKNWSAGKYQPKVLVLFDSMWNSTDQLAHAILEGATGVSDKVDVQLMHVRRTSLTRIATEMLDAAAVALGSPTLNMQIMPTMGGVLTYLKGLKFSPKSAVAFGSYGWASAGANQLDKWIEETGWTKVADPLTALLRPKEDTIQKAVESGRLLAEAAMKKCDV